MNNPFLNRLKKRGDTYHGRQSEKRNSKLLGGRETVASGILHSDKGDIDLPDMLVENKATINDALRLDHAWLIKITHEAVGKGKVPALIVNFVNGDGTPKLAGSWMMIPISEAKIRGLF